MNDNISTNGDVSPVIIGNNNKTKGKKTDNITVNQKVVWGLGGFVTGVVASLIANWIWHIFC